MRTAPKTKVKVENCTRSEWPSNTLSVYRRHGDKSRYTHADPTKTQAPTEDHYLVLLQAILLRLQIILCTKVVI